jgi:hypothetical protein
MSNDSCTLEHFLEEGTPRTRLPLRLTTMISNVQPTLFHLLPSPLSAYTLETIYSRNSFAFSYMLITGQLRRSLDETAHFSVESMHVD